MAASKPWGAHILGLLALLLPALGASQGVHELPEPYVYPVPSWSAYVVGGLIGLLVVAALAIVNKPIGASSAYASLAGLAGRVVAPRHTASLKYFSDNPPMIGWSILFVLGTILGAWLAVLGSGDFTGRYLQDMWVARFGADSHALRTVFALMGGVLLAFGARIAGGCTSGHGISGTLQLSVGSWVSVLCFFIGGIAVAMPLYRW